MESILKLRETTTQLTDELNHALANTIDLKLQVKQAHWNIKGENFIAIHELFDKLASDVDEYADSIAERIVQLHETAYGTLQTISKNSTLGAYSTEIHKTQEHVTAVSNATRTVANETRKLIDVAEKLKDPITEDILVEITRGLEKWTWLVESHNL